LQANTGFLAVMGEIKSWALNTRLIFETERHDPGANYNAVDGQYTCRASGVYMFS
jgi:hypothetical protein